MKKQSLFKRLAICMGLSVSLNMCIPVSADGMIFGEYAQGEILSFGSSLTKAQEQNLREYFKVSDDVEAIYVTTDVAVKQLGLDEEASKSYTGGWYSSAYVKLTEGTGINVKSDNLTLVTNDMLANALITSGILNADVIASAPFKVTGQSALAGILAGVEEIMGEELSQENKETAQKEIETTMDVADEIGQKEASAIMNEIKAEVIKDSPTNITQIENIVINITNNYGVELSEKTRARVVDIMSDINDLDINYKDVKNTLKEVSNKLFKDLQDTLDKGEDISIKIKDSSIMSDFIEYVKNLINSVIDFFNNIINDNKENNYINDSNDNIIDDVGEETMKEESIKEEDVAKEENNIIEENNDDNANMEDITDSVIDESINIDENISKNENLEESTNTINSSEVLDENTVE